MRTLWYCSRKLPSTFFALRSAARGRDEEYKETLGRRRHVTLLQGARWGRAMHPCSSFTLLCGITSRSGLSQSGWTTRRRRVAVLQRAGWSLVWSVSATHSSRIGAPAQRLRPRIVADRSLHWEESVTSRGDVAILAQLSASCIWLCGPRGRLEKILQGDQSRRQLQMIIKHDITLQLQVWKKKN